MPAPQGTAAAPDVGGAGRWDPRNTFVFAVGVLLYPDGQNWPEEGRRDAVMIDELQALGVPTSQITFIKDRNATVATVRRAFDAVMAEAPADATLWFYFAGHGIRGDGGVTEFSLYDGRWPIPDLYSTIERRFRGSMALMFADCCYSGALGTEAMLRAGRVRYGTLTSSLACTISTGAWTFTDCLIAALQGAIPLDANGDGLITFSELARFAEREMAFNDGQLSTVVTINGFDPDLVLVDGTKRTHPLIGEYVEARWSDGKWYPGRIEQVNGSNVLIRWAGYDGSEPEEVHEDNVRPFAPRQHAPGTRFEVEWQGEWYAAEVLTGRWGLHLVRYDGYDSTHDEWVAADRIRLK